jgi:cation transport regulator ChaC
LDYREKDNYLPRRIPLFEKSSHALLSSSSLCYIGKPETLFPAAPLDEVAQHIYRSVGPSGPNREYARKIQQALAQNGLMDEHIYGICMYMMHM